MHGFVVPNIEWYALDPLALEPKWTIQRIVHMTQAS